MGNQQKGDTEPTPLLSVDFPYDLHSLSPCSYIAGCVRLRLSLQPPAHSGSPLADFSTLEMEAIRSSETSVNTRSAQRHIPEDDILHSHRCESFKS
jgi:hypothetical protein